MLVDVLAVTWLLMYTHEFLLAPPASFSIESPCSQHSSTLSVPVQVVSDFLQSRLVGEGNVLRHLELLGYRLSYSQGALMEYPFAITNLAVDLRDGLRLIKVAEVLTGGPHWLCRVWFFQGAVLSA